jgi:hypothetical protein
VSDTPETDPLARFTGEEVVLDTQGPLIYIGRLVEVGATYVAMVEADVHDTNDSRASKDLYILETRDLGVRVNRSLVLIMRSQVASASLLRDVAD